MTLDWNRPLFYAFFLLLLLRLLHADGPSTSSDDPTVSEDASLDSFFTFSLRSECSSLGVLQVGSCGGSSIDTETSIKTSLDVLSAVDQHQVESTRLAAVTKIGTSFSLHFEIHQRKENPRILDIYIFHVLSRRRQNGASKLFEL